LGVLEGLDAQEGQTAGRGDAEAPRQVLEPRGAAFGRPGAASEIRAVEAGYPLVLREGARSREVAERKEPRHVRELREKLRRQRRPARLSPVQSQEARRVRAPARRRPPGQA